jgi:hypothetical protein
MSRPGPRLYDLLPAYVRYRDAAGADEPLKAVMEALELPFQVVRDDVDDLYRAWFIETCADWMVPYLGDLVGVRGLESSRRLLPTARARVANALAYRRAKGTPAALERAARDATGWPCRVVEYGRRTAASPCLDEAAAAGTVDLRRAADLELLGGPFNVLPHTADFKPSTAENPPLGDAGGFQLLQLGLAFWRLESYPVTGAVPAELGGDLGAEAGGESGGMRRYAFHPYGLDAPLFNAPATAGEPVFASTERHLPGPLRRLALADEIESLAVGRVPASDYLGSDAVFQILVAEDGGELQLLPPEALAIADLSAWEPAAVRTIPAPRQATVRAFVDPVLGRFLLPGGTTARRVRVAYSHGAAMDLGGGAYSRAESLRHARGVSWRAIVAEDCEPRYDPESRLSYFSSLAAALEAWNSGRSLPIPSSRRAGTAPQSGIIRICDSATYAGSLRIGLKDRWLAIEAADGCRPCLRGDLAVAGQPPPVMDAAWRQATPSAQSARQNELRVNGLWIEGGITIQGSALLFLEHCTVAAPYPGRSASPAVAFGAERDGAGELAGQGSIPERVVVDARRCILGPLDLGRRLVDLRLADCIVDAAGARAIDGSRTAADLARCTVLGEVAVGELARAVDVLFAAPVRATLVSDGEVRFSHVPAGSRTPPQERCQGGGAQGPTRVGAAVTPAFTSTAFGNPAYAQLSPAASVELRQGGEDGNEIGVYNRLRGADRLGNLPDVCEEFLPWGMTARVFFVT